MMRSAIGAVLLVFGVLCVAGNAHAQTRVVVHDFDGPFATRVREAVIEELGEHSIEVVEAADAASAASDASADLDTGAGRVAVARKLSVAAFVRGETERVGSAKARVTLTLYSGQDGSQLVDTKLVSPKPKLAKLARERMWKAFGPALQVARAPSAAAAPAAKPEPVESAEQAEPTAAREQEREQEETEEEQPAEEADDGEEREPSGAASPLDISLGARVGTRRFTYNDAFPGLRGYKLRMSPNIALQLHWYPGAHVTSGFAANVGLELRGEMMVGVSSKNSAGEEFDTSARELGFGLRLRFPFAQGSEAAAVAGYGMRSFGLGEAKGVGSGVPDVDYRFVRLGADARLVLFAPLSLLARAAFLLGLSQGEIGGDSWFPHASGHGLEGEAGLGLTIVDGFEAQALFVIQRFFMSFDPRINDASVQTQGRVAGGALDQYLSGRIALVWHMPN